MTDPAPEPELVQSGTFLVDRQRALERLRDYQFEDPKTFLLSWVRCAVLSGASYVSASAGRGEGLTLRFDGKPLAPERLRNPYSALFEDDADAERYRHLAVGLLAALRLEPGSITVSSGAGAERETLTVYSLEEPETFSAALDGEKDTLIRLPGGADAEGALSRLKSYSGMLKVPLTISGVAVPPLGEGPRPAVAFEEKGMRGVLVAREYGKPKKVNLYRQGVRVMSKPLDSPVSFAAHIDDDRFRLDASHGKIIEDPVLEGFGQQAVARHVDDLILKVCQEQAKRARDQAKDSMSISGLIGVPFSMRMRMVLTKKVPLPGAEALAKVEREAWLAAWLRRTAAVRLNAGMLQDWPGVKAADRALWETPIYVGVTGKPLSLASLQTQGTPGRVYYCTPTVSSPDPWVFGFEPSVPVVWLEDANDSCLRSLFGRKLREWQAFDTLRELAKLAAQKVRG